MVMRRLAQTQEKFGSVKGLKKLKLPVVLLTLSGIKGLARYVEFEVC